MKTHGSQPRPAPKIVVRGLSARSTRGVLTYGNLSFPCAIGRSGRRAGKREGDGATPLGSFALRRALYRPDRLPRPATHLTLRAIVPSDGWCDAPTDRNYNRRVDHPYPASAERLWRDDGSAMLRRMQTWRSATRSPRRVRRPRTRRGRSPPLRRRRTPLAESCSRDTARLAITIG